MDNVNSKVGSGAASGVVVLVAAVALTQIIFGAHYALAKQVLNYMPPLAWAGIRAVIAALVLGLISRLAGNKIWPRGKEWWAFGALALSGVVLNQALFVEGQARTITSHAAVIMASIPVMVVVIGTVFARERFGIGLAIGLALTAAGALILVRGDEFSWRQEAVVGDVLLLASSLANAVFIVLLRRMALKLTPLELTARMFACGSVVLLALAAPSLASMDWAAVPASAWGYGAAIVLGPTVAGFLLNSYVLRNLTATTVGVMKNGELLAAAVIAGTIMGEQLNWRFWTAALFIMGGITITALMRR